MASGVKFVEALQQRVHLAQVLFAARGFDLAGQQRQGGVDLDEVAVQRLFADLHHRLQVLDLVAALGLPGLHTEQDHEARQQRGQQAGLSGQRGGAGRRGHG